MSLSRQLEKSKTHGRGNKNYKTITCTRYASGWCEYDDECWFIHDQNVFASGRASPTTIMPPHSTARSAAIPYDLLGISRGLPRLEIPSSLPRSNGPRKSVDSYWPRQYHQAPVEAPVPASAQPCFAFQRGACAKGDFCTYRHDMSPRSPATSASSRLNSDRHRSPGKQPCFDLMRTGKCPKGESCIFSHEDIGRYIQWFRDVDCKLFAVGKCKHGDTCLFKHASPTLNIDQTASDHLFRSPPRSPVYNHVQNLGRRCPFSTDSMVCTNPEMCYVHGSPTSPSSFYPRRSQPLSPTSSFGPPSSWPMSYHTKTNSTSSFDDYSSSYLASPISSASYGSFMSRVPSLGHAHTEDPLGIMRCIDDSDDEYIVYEGTSPFRA